MIVIIEKYYTPIDRYLNKAKRKGFWLYTGIIVISLGYIMYEISNLPDLPPPPSTSSKNSKSISKSTKKEQDKTKVKRRSESLNHKSTHSEVEQEEEISLGPSNPVLPLDQTHEDDHIINKWSKKKLFQFLFDNRIYPDVNENLDLIRKQVIEIYELKKHNNELDKKYLI